MLLQEIALLQEITQALASKVAKERADRSKLATKAWHDNEDDATDRALKNTAKQERDKESRNKALGNRWSQGKSERANRERNAAIAREYAEKRAAIDAETAKIKKVFETAASQIKAELDAMNLDFGIASNPHEMKRGQIAIYIDAPKYMSVSWYEKDPMAIANMRQLRAAIDPILKKVASEHNFGVTHEPTTSYNDYESIAVHKKNN